MIFNFVHSRINAKRNFDEIGHGGGWGRFVRKRNFDEIDGGRGFGSRFAKKVIKTHAKIIFSTILSVKLILVVHNLNLEIII